MSKLEEIFGEVKDYVQKFQAENGRAIPPRGPGIRLDEISEGTGIDEDLILLALSNKSLTGELQGTDILLTFMD